jgi:hypothetical protein
MLSSLSAFALTDYGGSTVQHEKPMCWLSHVVLIQFVVKLRWFTAGGSTQTRIEIRSYDATR